MVSYSGFMRVLSWVAVVVASFLWVPNRALAQTKEISLSAPAEMVENGFLQYLLPRFSLKNGIRVAVVGAGVPADASLTVGSATPLFSDGTRNLGITVSSGGDDADRFATWLRSEVGIRTVLAFKVEDAQIYFKPAPVEKVAAPVVWDGDAAKGLKVSLSACGRCHVVGDINRMQGIGSTPSFAVLRTLENWQNRFEAFYVLNPHPAFTIIPDVTEAFDETRPPPIAPIQVSLEDLEDILAYVASLAPADLGGPIQDQ